MAAGSFVLAYIVALYVDARSPAVFEAIARIIPGPINPTGFAVAYAMIALLIYLVLTSLLFFTGKRRV
jgi:hypothetical protein